MDTASGTSTDTDTETDMDTDNDTACGPDDNSKGDSHSKVGAIVGGIFAAVVMMALLLAAALAFGYFLGRRCTIQANSYNTTTSEPTHNLGPHSTQAIYELASTSTSYSHSAHSDNQENTTATTARYTTAPDVNLKTMTAADYEVPISTKAFHAGTSTSSPFSLPLAHKIGATVTSSIDVQENPAYGPIAPHTEVQEHSAYGTTPPYEENSSYELQSPWLCP